MNTHHQTEWFLTELLSAEFNSAPVMTAPKDTVDWKRLCVFSVKQGVLPLIYQKAVNMPDFPKEQLPIWKKQYDRIVVENLRVSNAQKKLVRLLEEQDFPYVILKGFASAFYYAEPSLRSCGDVDFLIQPEMLEPVETVLMDAGYLREEENHPNHHVFKKPGSDLELHFGINGLPPGKPGEMLEQIFSETISKRVRMSGICGDFYAPCPLHHGLLLLVHICHHWCSEGIGLRQLCDWAAFVQKTANDSFWQELLAIFEQIGLLRAAALLTKISALYLKIGCPAWAQNADEELAAALMDDIMTLGNYGRADRKRSQSAGMIMSPAKHDKKRGKISMLFHMAHQYEKMRFPIVRKCILLYPVFDGWMALRYFGRVLTGKRRSLFTLVPEANDRQRLYDQLKLYEKE